MTRFSKEKFKILPHTADVRLLIFGNSFAEIFQNALLGMKQILNPKELNVKTQWRRIKVESIDPTALLIDFLSEVLYLIQTNNEIYDELKIFNLTPNFLEGAIIGKKVECFFEDIKAVTYHEAYLEQKSDNLWEALVIFDL